MKGLFIPEITAEMFRNSSLESIEALIAEGEIYDIEYSKWIPCSERLPEAFSFVNCTCHSLIDDREDWVVETCYLPQLTDSPYSDWGNIPMLNMGDCEVVAWMYRDIPKPYKVEPQESEVKNDKRESFNIGTKDS